MPQKILRALGLFILITAGAATVPAVAHQQKAAITKVLFNPRTGNIEVMHRFYLHDAEHAVRQIFGKDTDIIGTTETQSLFADYVGERFALKNGDVELPLSPVGFEIERAFFWVYQETPMVADINDLTIKHNALRDVWPQQINTVNIEGLDEIKTATFSGSVELKTITIKE
jgi:hypothetical protein